MDKAMKSWLKKLKLNESTISMILGALVVIVVGVLVFNYFSKGEKGEINIEEEPFIEEVVKPEEGIQVPKIHRVEAGENLWALATKYYQDGYKWVEIAKVNNLTNPSLISPGQELNIPVIEGAGVKAEATKTEMESIAGEKYTVKKGDCLWFIALRAYGDPYKWSEVAKANKLVDPNLIHPGNEFILPR